MRETPFLDAIRPSSVCHAFMGKHGKRLKANTTIEEGLSLLD